MKPYFISSHKQQIFALRTRMEGLQHNYLYERQDLSSRLLQAIRSQEVNTDPVTLGMYAPSTHMSNVNPGPPAMAEQYHHHTVNGIDAAAYGAAAIATTAEAALAQVQATLPPPVPQPAPLLPPPVPQPAPVLPPMTTSVPMTVTASSAPAMVSAAAPLQYAAVLPGSYQIHVNPDGSQHMIQLHPHQQTLPPQPQQQQAPPMSQHQAQQPAPIQQSQPPVPQQSQQPQMPPQQQQQPMGQAMAQPQGQAMTQPQAVPLTVATTTSSNNT